MQNDTTTTFNKRDYETLKHLTKKIQSYPLDKFGSNALSSKLVRLESYFNLRAYRISRCEESLQQAIKQAYEDLMILNGTVNGIVVRLICP